MSSNKTEVVKSGGFWRWECWITWHSYDELNDGTKECAYCGRVIRDD